jgi:hypothetical protein
MPTLKHLIDELQKLSVNSNEICVLGPPYDYAVDHGGDTADDDDDADQKRGSAPISPRNSPARMVSGGGPILRLPIRGECCTVRSAFRHGLAK